MASTDFRPYFVGVTDEQIKELGLECADMNHSFLFRNRQGHPRDLKYSSDALNNDRRYYKISEVLDCIKEAKTDYLHRLQGEIL